MQGALARTTLNIGGLNPFKRRIISNIVTSTMLYAWLVADFVGTTRRKHSSVNRLSMLRQISGFRKLSLPGIGKDNTDKHIDNRDSSSMSVFSCTKFKNPRGFNLLFLKNIE